MRKQSPLAQLCDVLDRLRSLSISAAKDFALEDLSTFFVANHDQSQALVRNNEATEAARLSLVHHESNQLAPAELVRMHNEYIVPLLERLLSADDRASVKPTQDEPLTTRIAHLARLKLIGYAIANNFAGMEDRTSREETYKFIRGVLSPVIEGRSAGIRLEREISQLPLLEPVAQTLFCGAIENGDVTAVSCVLSWPGVKIDVDNILCNLEGKRLTPIEAAAFLHIPQLINVLLQHNANINGSADGRSDRRRRGLACKCSMRSAGALYHALQRPRDDFELTEMIIKLGGTICSVDVNAVTRPGRGSLIELLLNNAVPQGCLSRIQAGVLRTVMERLDEMEQRAVLLAGHSVDLKLEIEFPPSYLTHVNCYADRRIDFPCRIIDIACQRGQLETVRWLHGEHYSFTNSTLVAGIRSLNAELVDFLLAEGAPTLCFSEEYSTTPFAEAVRAKNKQLSCTLQKSHGITQLLHDERAFCVTLAAAAEAGVEELFSDMMTRRSRLHPEILGFALTRACQSNDASMARRLLESGASVARSQYTDVMGCARDANFDPACTCPCPLASAISNRNEEMIELLLDHDAGDRKKLCLRELFQSSTPQMSAIRWDVIRILRLLLGAGFNFDAGELLSTAIRAAHLDLVRFLLTNFSVNELHNSHHRLHRQNIYVGYHGEAIMQQDSCIIRLLLDHDIALNLAYDPGAFALALQLAPHVYQELINKSLSYPSSLACRRGTCHFQEIWHQAITRKRPDMLHWMASSLTHQSRDQDDTYFPEPDLVDLAIQNGEEFALKFLVECGFDLDEPVFDEYGVLMGLPRLERLHDGSRRRCNTILLKYIKMDNLQAVKTLLDLGASANLPAKFGIKRTPIQQAAETGSISIIELLLSRGADINAPPSTRDGATPAQLAAMSGFTGVLECLERHGDNVWAPACTVNGRTALEGAAEHGRYEMVHWLASRDSPDLSQYEKAAKFASDNGHPAIASMLKSMFNARTAEIESAKVQEEVRMRMAKQVSDSRKYKCRTCPAAFVRATTLRRHERSHKEIYPYRCAECDRGFRRKDTLDRHIETHAGGTHQCHICGSEHSRRDVLLKHMRDEHRDAQLWPQ